MRNAVRQRFVPLGLVLALGAGLTAMAGGPARAAADHNRTFDFGPGLAAPDHVAVTEDTAYSSRTGYGFVEPSQVTCTDRLHPDPLLSDFCTPGSTAFAVDLPEGDYRVTVHSGDAQSAGDTEVYAEGYREAKARLTSQSGAFAAEKFLVYVYDGRLELTFKGRNSNVPRVNGLEIHRVRPDQEGKKSTVYLAGDSTVASYPERYHPLTGWGQRIPDNFTDDVVFDNRAIAARSSATFALEGHLDRIMTALRPGDYLFMQFGHNDRVRSDHLCPNNPAYCDRYAAPYTRFKEFLKLYIHGARFHGATPVLVTPMGRRNYDDQGRFVNDFTDYATAMRQLSAEFDVPLIDLNAKSIAYYNEIGVEATKQVFLYTAPGQYPAWPNGRADNVHFQVFGADQLSIMVTQGVREAGLGIAPAVTREKLLPLPS